jgi:hypothetical protein
VHEDAAAEIAEGVKDFGEGDHSVPGDDAVGFVFPEEVLDRPDRAASAAGEDPRMMHLGTRRRELRAHFTRFSENEEAVADRGRFPDEAQRVALATAAGGPGEEMKEALHAALRRFR